VVGRSLASNLAAVSPAGVVGLDAGAADVGAESDAGLDAGLDADVAAADVAGDSLAVAAVEGDEPGGGVDAVRGFDAHATNSTAARQRARCRRFIVST
jgi:hypothetical protein